MTPRKLTALGLALLSVGALPALAHTPDQAALRQFCTGDYMRLCAQYKPNTPELEQRFKAPSKELSPGCQNAIAAYTKAGQPARR